MKINKTLIAMVALPFALAIGTTAHAKQKFPQVDDSIETPEMLSYLKDNGGEIHARFRVNEHLNGFAISINNDRLIVYATADGQYVFNGSLLDKKADDVTQKLAKKFLPKTNAYTQLERVENSKYLVTHKEKSEKTLYVIHDPNCPYCKHAHQTIMANPHAPVSVRWIPVGALGKDSAEKAAVLLAKQSMSMQDDFDMGYGIGEKEKPLINDKMQDVIENTRLMKYLGITGTPAIIVVEGEEITDVIQGYRQGDILKAMKL